MLESGLNIIDLGLLPTGLFYFSLFNMDVDGGIMITGSHNPGDQNGFKVAFGKATIFGSEIQYLRTIIEQRDSTWAKVPIKPTKAWWMITTVS